MIKAEYIESGTFVAGEEDVFKAGIERGGTAIILSEKEYNDLIAGKGKPKDEPIAYVFMPGETRRQYIVKPIYNSILIKGCALSGIIWLRQPTEEERMCMVPCLFPNGFELIASPLNKP